MLATLCALIAVASLSWGYPIRRWIAAVLVVLAFLSVVLAEIVPHLFGDESGDGWRMWLSWSAVAIVAITVRRRLPLPQQGRERSFAPEPAGTATAPR